MAKDDQKARQERADELRKQIEELKSDAEAPAGKDDAEMRPDESPLEYVERRSRELSHKKPKAQEQEPTDE